VSPLQRNYLYGQSGVGAALANALLNAAAGWVIVRSLGELSVWGFPGVMWDFLGMAFGISFGTVIGLKFTVPRDVAKNKMTLLVLSPGWAAFIGRFPLSTMKRAFWFGLISIPLFALPALVVLAVFEVQALAARPFIILKTVLAAVQAAVVTPLVALGVLSDMSRIEATKQVVAVPAPGE
jgi:hypothetical protein